MVWEVMLGVRAWLWIGKHERSCTTVIRGMTVCQRVWMEVGYKNEV